MANTATQNIFELGKRCRRKQHDKAAEFPMIDDARKRFWSTVHDSAITLPSWADQAASVD